MHVCIDAVWFQMRNFEGVKFDRGNTLDPAHSTSFVPTDSVALRPFRICKIEWHLRAGMFRRVVGSIVLNSCCALDCTGHEQ